MLAVHKSTVQMNSSTQPLCPHALAARYRVVAVDGREVIRRMRGAGVDSEEIRNTLWWLVELGKFCGEKLSASGPDRSQAKEFLAAAKEKFLRGSAEEVRTGSRRLSTGVRALSWYFIERYRY